MRIASQLAKRFIPRDKLKVEKNGLCHTGRQWKIKFTTRENAEKANSTNLDIYRCQKCNHYHLTKMKQ